MASPLCQVDPGGTYHCAATENKKEVETWCFRRPPSYRAGKRINRDEHSVQHIFTRNTTQPLRIHTPPSGLGLVAFQMVLIAASLNHTATIPGMGSFVIRYLLTNGKIWRIPVQQKILSSEVVKMCCWASYQAALSSMHLPLFLRSFTSILSPHHSSTPCHCCLVAPPASAAPPHLHPPPPWPPKAELVTPAPEPGCTSALHPS